MAQKNRQYYPKLTSKVKIPKKQINNTKIENLVQSNNKKIYFEIFIEELFLNYSKKEMVLIS